MTLTKFTHEEITEEEFAALKSPGKITISNNTLTFKNTVYQIKNISRAIVRERPSSKTKKVPAYQVIAWFFLGALTFTASEDLSTKLLGVVITFAGIAFYIESRKKTERNYLLELELNSGSSTYFKSASGDFLGKFIEGLDYVMKNPHAGRFIEADFTTQQIQEVNDLDNLIDISDDIVQEFIRASTTQSLSASRQR